MTFDVVADAIAERARTAARRAPLIADSGIRPHERGALQQFLAQCEPGSPVPLETIGNWYWIVDEIEAAGCVPKPVHARKAKLTMGEINKAVERFLPDIRAVIQRAAR